MRRKLSTIFMALGAVLLAAALLLFAQGQWEAYQAGNAADDALIELKSAIGNDEVSMEDGFPVLNINGTDYMGYLSFPTLNMALPVMKQWSYEGLHTAPGRYSGSTYTNDLVICGHNYYRHFTPVKSLPIGAEVYFVDAAGTVWHYQVSSVEVLQPTQVKEMTTKVDGEEWDLTLFTCTTGGTARCAVRCTLL